MNSFSIIYLLLLYIEGLYQVIS